MKSYTIEFFRTSSAVRVRVLEDIVEGNLSLAKVDA